MSRKRVPLNQNECTDDFRIGVPFEQNLHVSVIERGLKVTKLDTFVAIANVLDVSADTLLIDVVAHSVTGVTNELTEKIEKLPIKEQKKIIKVIHTLLEE